MVWFSETCVPKRIASKNFWVMREGQLLHTAVFRSSPIAFGIGRKSQTLKRENFFQFFIHRTGII
jgi:hypothetical protein